SSDQATFQSMIERLGLKSNYFHGEFNQAGQLTMLELKYTTVLKSPLRELPWEVQSFRHLKVLGLSNNQLEGIASFIGELSELEGLYAINNFIPSLPAEMSKLTKLRAISLVSI